MKIPESKELKCSKRVFVPFPEDKEPKTLADRDAMKRAFKTVFTYKRNK